MSFNNLDFFAEKRGKFNVTCSYLSYNDLFHGEMLRNFAVKKPHNFLLFGLFQAVSLHKRKSTSCLFSQHFTSCTDARLHHDMAGIVSYILLF